jgi:hypothetical protein
LKISPDPFEVLSAPAYGRPENITAGRTDLREQLFTITQPLPHHRRNPAEDIWSRTAPVVEMSYIE